jgi:hypothetical protein
VVFVVFVVEKNKKFGIKLGLRGKIFVNLQEKNI